jgi:hypothetical protein
MRGRKGHEVTAQTRKGKESIMGLAGHQQMKGEKGERARGGREGEREKISGLV